MKDKNIGKIIGIYEICSVCDERFNDGHLKYHVKCIKCGFETEMKLSDIKRCKTCKHINSYGNYISYSYKWKNKRIKSIFWQMVNRCYNNQNKNYRFYGAKGIKICDEWLNNPIAFEQWALQNGYEDNLTIDRIDSNKDYCPNNCQWISREENTRKAGNVNWINVDNKILTGRQWSEKLGLGINTINAAIRDYGLYKTTELIHAMLQDPPSLKHRNSNQSWFSVYGIEV